MKITNNGSDIIHHLTSCSNSKLNSLCEKVKNLWSQLAKLFTLIMNNDNSNSKIEKVVTMPTKQSEEMNISWIFNEPIGKPVEENELLYTSIENIYEEINDEPIYEEIPEPIYEEIPGAEQLFLQEESIYDIPMNNKPVETKSSTTLGMNSDIKRIISDIESHLDNAKKSTPPKLSILEGSEISI